MAGIARTGLAFTESGFERERYEEILQLAAQIKEGTGRGYDAEHQVIDWMGEVGERTAGYATPKTTIGAVVGNDDGEILLVKRADSGIWLYPTGWADIGYSPAEIAVKRSKKKPASIASRSACSLSSMVSGPGSPAFRCTRLSSIAERPAERSRPTH